MTAQDARRKSHVLDEPLARLDRARDELAKAWLLRIAERASLDEIGRMPMDRIARELPALIGDVLRLVRPDAEEHDDEAGRHERATRLTALRGAPATGAAEMMRDVAALQSIMVAALGRELRDLEPTLFVDAVERLATVFGSIQAAAVEEVVRSRSRELEWLANTDALTGLYNVRYLQQHLRQLLGVHKRYGHPFALLLLDVDGLKRINDGHGHAVGDRALVGVAEAIRETIRGIDTPVRMGGDEFCILAPHQTASRGNALGQRLGAAVDRIQLPGSVGVGLSIGVVSCPQHGEEPERLLELADSAMYEAKADGRSVAVAVSPGGEPFSRSDLGEGRSDRNGR